MLDKKFFSLSIIVSILASLAILFFDTSPLPKFSFSELPSSAPPSSTSTSQLSPTPTSTTSLYKPVIDYEKAVIAAVKKTSDSVVSIIISKDLPVVEEYFYNPFSDLPEEFQEFFSQEFFQFYGYQQKGTQRQKIGGGSGFIISSDGLIVTNKHVVSDSSASYTVLTNDGEKYEAEVLARHPTLDLAVIKIKAENLSVISLGDSGKLELGQTAIAIGNALGEFRNTVSVGIIAGLGRKITASGGGIIETIEGVIQTDTAINQGNSGGPLLNLKGEVIGINVAMVSGAQNIGFAIPINQVKKAIESVKKNKKIVIPYLGIRYLIITPELAKKEKLPVEKGVLVRGSEEGPAVLENSPAQRAGIQAEDIILEFNEEIISPSHSIALLIQKYDVGETVKLKILRKGEEITLEATLGEKRF